MLPGDTRTNYQKTTCQLYALVPQFPQVEPEVLSAQFQLKGDIQNEKSVSTVNSAAFMVAAPLAMAKAEKVNCCVKGKCSKMTTAKCDKAMGDVVKNCKDCKKPPMPVKPRM